MAIKKSTFTGGMARAQLHSPYVAHVVTEAIVEHTFREALATTDILELCVLPAYCKVLSAELLTVGTSTTTLDVGFMSGKPFDPDATRTSGDQLFDGVTPTTKQDATIAALSALPVSDSDRSIGVKGSAEIAASASTKVYLRIRYAKGLK